MKAPKQNLCSDLLEKCESRSTPTLDLAKTSGSSPPVDSDCGAERSVVCAECGKSGVANEYYKKAGRLDGTCKTCRQLQRRKRYQSELLEKSALLTGESKPAATAIIDATLVSTPIVLTEAEILRLAEAFLMLERWQADLDTQQELSNSK